MSTTQRRRMIDPSHIPTQAECLERAQFADYTRYCIERGFYSLAKHFAIAQVHALRFTDHAELLQEEIEETMSTTKEKILRAREHTPEPWKMVDAATIHCPLDMALATVRAHLGQGEANTRRIVAAVNACKGIPTEALEQGVVGEMAEALLAFMGLITERADDMYDEEGFPTEELNRVRGRAEAALRKAGRLG